MTTCFNTCFLLIRSIMIRYKQCKVLRGCFAALLFLLTIFCGLMINIINTEKESVTLPYL